MEQLEKYALGYEKRILEAVDCPIKLLHICSTPLGNAQDKNLMESGWINKYPATAINWDDHAYTPIERGKELYGDKYGIIGGLNFRETLRSGTPKQVEEETRKAIEAAGEDGGFRLVSTAIARYEKPGGSKARRVVAGLLLHRDPVGRYYSTMFEVDYRLFQDGSMVIDASTVEPVEAPVPATFVCFVPAEKVSRAVLSSGTFSKLFKHAMKNAVSRQQASKSDRSKKDYFVFSFFMDHLAEDAEVGLLISKEKEGISGNSKKTVTFQEHGWHVAYTRSSLALDGNHEIFFKVVYTPGGRVPTKQHFPVWREKLY